MFSLQQSSQFLNLPNLPINVSGDNCKKTSIHLFLSSEESVDRENSNTKSLWILSFDITVQNFLSSMVQGLVINYWEEICLGEILSCCSWFCALGDRQNFALSIKHFRIWFYRVWYSWKTFGVEFGVYTEKLIEGNLLGKRKIWFVNFGWDHTQYC